MKNWKILGLLLVMILGMSSCFWENNNEEVNKAKQNMWINEVDNGSSFLEDNIKEVDMDSSFDEKEEKKEEIKKIEIKELTEEQYIKIDELDLTTLMDKQVEISWKTLKQVDKIIVNFKNQSSDFPEDSYKLTKFNSWDDNFLYRAYEKYETIDDWINVYTIEAYSWDKVSRTQVILKVVTEEEIIQEEKTEKIEEEDVNKTSSKDDINTEISLTELPNLEQFWKIEKWVDWIISYSELDWLTIKKEEQASLTCENLTTKLAWKIDGWFYWNTCRPIKDDNGFTYFVIRLDDDDNYYYEKDYYLLNQNYYIVQLLEKWEWVTNKNIKAKNTALKELNDSFSSIEKSDELVAEILK